MILFVTLMSSLIDQILLVVIKGKLQARERSPSTHWLFGSQSTMSSLAWMETEETSCKKMFRAHLILIWGEWHLQGFSRLCLEGFQRVILYTHTHTPQSLSLGHCRALWGASVCGFPAACRLYPGRGLAVAFQPWSQNYGLDCHISPWCKSASDHRCQ